MSPPADRWRSRWASPGGQRWRSIAYWVALAALIGVVVWRYTPDYRLPDLGPAPTLVADDLDGRTVRLDDFAGQVVVVNVWATWCPPCVVETPGFVDLASEFAGDVQFLGVSVDEDPGAVAPFAARYGVTYPLLLAATVRGQRIEAPVLPTTLVIDRAGRVRMRHEGLLLEPALRPVLKRLARERGGLPLR